VPKAGIAFNGNSTFIPSATTNIELSIMELNTNNFSLRTHIEWNLLGLCQNAGILKLKHRKDLDVVRFNIASVDD
jgi:hypothetical protein